MLASWLVSVLWFCRLAGGINSAWDGLRQGFDRVHVLENFREAWIEPRELGPCAWRLASGSSL